MRRRGGWPRWTTARAPCWPGRKRWLATNSSGSTARSAASGRHRRRAPMDRWDPEADRRRLECVHVGPAELRRGDRVRLRPLGRADIMDLALAGRAATIESIEQDYEGRVYLAVTVDDDPGKDLGALRQVGHRFFFQPDEVEPLES